MNDVIELLLPGRPRDLGGLHVERVLPAVKKRSIGPFVFLDHMDPSPEADVQVRPHPHLHLATVTYLFEGEIVHRDSLGSQQAIHPGAINWMTAGKGIVHSERSPRPMPMHGLQLWVGLPQAHEDSEPSFVHHPAATLPELDVDGARVRVLIGDAHGKVSPVATLSPMLYLDVRLAPGGRFEVPRGHAERGAYIVEGNVMIGSARVEHGALAVIAGGTTPVISSEAGARLVILGGEPLDGPRYIWWNFVSSSKERIIEAAHAWRDGAFARIPGDEVEFIPAPPEDPRFASGS